MSAYDCKLQPKSEIIVNTKANNLPKVNYQIALYMQTVLNTLDYDLLVKIHTFKETIYIRNMNCHKFLQNNDIH